MDISKLTMVELKALAFDVNNELQNSNNNLQIIIKELERRIKEDNDKKEIPEIPLEEE